MRRIATLLLVAAALLAPVAARAAETVFDTTARAAIMIDARTGAVLFEKNPDEALPPASMSKLMTAYMVFERLKEGSLKMTDELPVSERAWRTGGSKMFVEVGKTVSVSDLLRGMIIQSGNDACIVLAEAIAGSEEAFAQLMTERARELGMTSSHFANANGLPDPQHYMSVRDLATLARHIIEDFPEYYGIYAEEEYTFNGIRQFSRNPLLRAGVPGVDGLKTGHTQEAGYGLVASAKRGERRLILVMAGLKTDRLRAQESRVLLEHGFRDFQEYVLFREGTPVAEAAVWMGAAPRVPLGVARDMALTLSRDARKGLSARLVFDAPVKAPVAAGQVVGRAIATVGDAPAQEIPLVALQPVAEAGLLGRAAAALSQLIGGGS
jgi:D-alanyl-D-alanine carboxypeptidase (penicillin-binding protein 5/6)